MNILEQIRNCKNDEELMGLAKYICGKLTLETFDIYDNCEYKVIGGMTGYNPLEYYIDDLEFDGESNYPFINCWNGYIPLGVKIVYGNCYNYKYKVFVNDGYYYYIDDDSFVFDFFKYIKNCKIEEEYDIVLAIFKFIEKNYFSFLENRDRKDIHKMIYKNDSLYFDRINEHSINDFSKDKSFMCTEHSFFMQNLLSVFGIYSLYVMDKDHAYNICLLDDLDNNNEKNYYIVDSSEFVCCYDYNFNITDRMPYIQKIKDCNYELLQKLVDGDVAFEYKNYCFYEINGVGYKLDLHEKRKYGAECGFLTDCEIICDDDKDKILIK